MGNISKKITEIDVQIKEVRTELLEVLDNIPDNPNLKRLSPEGKCFSINTSNGGNNLSPFFHDNLAQRNLLKEMIYGSKNLNYIQNQLEKVVEKGMLKYKSNNYQFNNQVREYLKSIL